jgi:Ran-binding protein 1
MFWKNGTASERGYSLRRKKNEVLGKQIKKEEGGKETGRG